jgi:DUF3102 family protein
VATRKQWAKLITEAWQKSVGSIVETGDLLVQAKEDLEHGEWLPMIESDLPFGRQAAHRLMVVARHPVLSNVAHGPHLPASWRTLYELTKIDKKLGNGAQRRSTTQKIVRRTRVS